MDHIQGFYRESEKLQIQSFCSFELQNAWATIEVSWLGGIFMNLETVGLRRKWWRQQNSLQINRLFLFFFLIVGMVLETWHKTEDKKMVQESGLWQEHFSKPVRLT